MCAKLQMYDDSVQYDYELHDGPFDGSVIRFASGIMEQTPTAIVIQFQAEDVGSQHRGALSNRYEFRDHPDGGPVFTFVGA